jgi:hypothetical protein
VDPKTKPIVDLADRMASEIRNSGLSQFEAQCAIAIISALVPAMGLRLVPIIAPAS